MKIQTKELIGPAPPCEMSPAELAYRVKWLAAEMDTVGTADVRRALGMQT